jgi:DNA-binding response OmpR family regulator
LHSVSFFPNDSSIFYFTGTYCAADCIARGIQANEPSINPKGITMERNILLIDDDEDELEIFTEALSKLPDSFSCLQAKDTEQAIEVLNQLVPGYIFIDFNMPKKNGLECLRELRTIKGLEPVQFIIYSNFIDEQTKIKALSLGATACMKKPYLTSVLAQRLKEILIKE